MSHKLHDMPHEILSKIFQEGQIEYVRQPPITRSQSDDFKPFALLVSQVSSRWRAVALRTSSLWAYIRLSPENRTLAFLFLSRANQMPLEITAEFLNTHDHSHHATSADFLIYNITRVRRLTIWVGLALVDLLSPLRDVRAPLLEVLEIRRVDTHAHRERYQSFWLMPFLTGGVPSLTQFKLSLFALPWLFAPLSSLLTLELKLDFVMPPSFTELRDLLATAPQLSRLVLYSCSSYKPSDTGDTGIIVTASSLRSLELGYGKQNIDGRGDYLRQLCLVLRTPLLEELELSDDITLFHSISNAQIGLYVRSLTLRTMSLEGQASGNELTRSFPNLQRLTLIDVDSLPFLRLLQEQEQGSLSGYPVWDTLNWPNLRILTVNATDGELLRSIRSSLHLRLESGTISDEIAMQLRGNGISLDFFVYEDEMGEFLARTCDVVLDEDQGPLADERVLCPE